MKYIIAENRMINLVRELVSLVNPNFNQNDAGIATYSNGDDTYLEYYDKDRRKYTGGKPVVFAKYYVWTNELQLNRDLFLTLEDYFGEERMTFIIDWFNNEFDQDAESITF